MDNLLPSVPESAQDRDIQLRYGVARVLLVSVDCVRPALVDSHAAMMPYLNVPTLTDHRADRKAWLMAMLDLPATADDSGAYQWERVTPDQPDHMPLTQRLMHVRADRTAWKSALAEAKRRAADQATDLSATSGRAA